HRADGGGRRDHDSGGRDRARSHACGEPRRARAGARGGVMPSAATTFETQVLARDDVAANTMAFYFERPSGFEFKAGQSMDLTIVDPPETDAEGSTRTFTIASPP